MGRRSGVHDDGAACIAAWQALRIIHDLELQPRRTLRVVLWTNEENGLRGARAYGDALSDAEMANHVAAIEMDGGNETPLGFGLGLNGVDANGTNRTRPTKKHLLGWSRSLVCYPPSEPIRCHVEGAGQISVR